MFPGSGIVTIDSNYPVQPHGSDAAPFSLPTLSCPAIRASSSSGSLVQESSSFTLPLRLRPGVRAVPSSGSLVRQSPQPDSPRQSTAPQGGIPHSRSGTLSNPIELGDEGHIIASGVLQGCTRYFQGTRVWDGIAGTRRGLSDNALAVTLMVAQDRKAELGAASQDVSAVRSFIAALENERERRFHAEGCA